MNITAGTSIRAGLIGVLESPVGGSVSIDELHIVKASVAVSGTSGRAGILVGTVKLTNNNVSIEECSTGGTVENSSSGCTGGMVGAAEGNASKELKIENCINRASVSVDLSAVSGLSGYLGVGGFIGSISGSTKFEIDSSSNYGRLTVKGVPTSLVSDTSLGVGGAVGYSDTLNNEIKAFVNSPDIGINVLASTTVSLTKPYKIYGGGAAGYCKSANIERVRSISPLSVQLSYGGANPSLLAGGVIGGYDFSVGSLKIKYSYSRGSVTVKNTGIDLFDQIFAGGIAGEAMSNMATEIKECYSYGAVSINGDASQKGAGGIIGVIDNNNYNNVSECVYNNSAANWHGITNSVTSGSDVTPKSAVDMLQAATYSAFVSGSWLSFTDGVLPELKGTESVEAVCIDAPSGIDISKNGSATLNAFCYPDEPFLSAAPSYTWNITASSGINRGGNQFMNWTPSGSSLNINTLGFASTAVVSMSAGGKNNDITLYVNGVPFGSPSSPSPSQPPASGDATPSQPVNPVSGDDDGYTRSDDVSPQFSVQIESSRDVHQEFIAANDILASSDVTVYPGNAQPTMTDLPHDAAVVETLGDVDLAILSPNADVLPVCFIPSGKSALSLRADVRNSVMRSVGRGDSATKKALLPMTYVVKINKSEARQHFGADTDKIFASPQQYLDEIFKYYVIQLEVRQGERKGWFTRLVRGIMTPADAVAKGVLKVEGTSDKLILTLSYYVMDGAGEAFVHGSYLIVPDGMTDRVITDSIWLNKWSKACNSPSASSGGGGGGCSAGFGVLAIITAGALIKRRNVK